MNGNSDGSENTPKRDVHRSDEESEDVSGGRRRWLAEGDGAAAQEDAALNNAACRQRAAGRAHNEQTGANPTRQDVDVDEGYRGGADRSLRRVIARARDFFNVTVIGVVCCRSNARRGHSGVIGAYNEHGDARGGAKGHVDGDDVRLGLTVISDVACRMREGSEWKRSQTRRPKLR